MLFGCRIVFNLTLVFVLFLNRFKFFCISKPFHALCLLKPELALVLKHNYSNCFRFLLHTPSVSIMLIQ